MSNEDFSSTQQPQHHAQHLSNVNSNEPAPNVSIDRNPPVHKSVSHDHTYASNEKYNLFVLNVCGIISRLKTPDFEEHILKYDFVIVTETKCDDVDTSIIMNFFFQYWLFITI